MGPATKKYSDTLYLVPEWYDAVELSGLSAPDDLLGKCSELFTATRSIPSLITFAVCAVGVTLIIGDIFTPCLTCRLKRRSASYGPNHAIRNSGKAPKHLGPVAIAIDRSATTTFVSTETPHQNPDYGAQVGCGIPPRPI